MAFDENTSEDKCETISLSCRMEVAMGQLESIVGFIRRVSQDTPMDDPVRVIVIALEGLSARLYEVDGRLRRELKVRKYDAVRKMIREGRIK